MVLATAEGTATGDFSCAGDTTTAPRKQPSADNRTANRRHFGEGEKMM